MLPCLASMPGAWGPNSGPQLYSVNILPLSHLPSPKSVVFYDCVAPEPFIKISQSGSIEYVGPVYTSITNLALQTCHSQQPAISHLVGSLEGRHRGTLSPSDSRRGFGPSPFPKAAAVELITCLPPAGAQAGKLMGNKEDSQASRKEK